MMGETSLRRGVLAAGTLWAAGALLLAAVAWLHVGRAWTGILCGLALVLMAVGLLVVIVSLGPFNRIGQSMEPIRRGDAARLSGSYPAELQPLVDDLNELLRRNRQALERARVEADNLAHGLKTPLTILANQIRALGEKDCPQVLDFLRQIEAMERQIRIHLTRARAAAARRAFSPSSRCEVEPVVERLVRTMHRLYRERPRRVQVTDLAGNLFAGDCEDLEEILGNVLDNAFKWARTEVHVRSHQLGDWLVLSIDDDGPGLTELERSTIFIPATRSQGLASEGQPGSGVGLTIVSSLVQLYGGRVELERAEIGGLHVVLTLPAADSKDPNRE